MIKNIKSIIFKTHVYKITDMRDFQNELLSLNIFQLYNIKFVKFFSVNGKYYRIKKLIRCY